MEYQREHQRHSASAS
jgi:hypothetical protein